MKVFSLLFFVLTVFKTVSAQEKSDKIYRPDIPGSFLVDFGVNGTDGSPKEFEKSFFGSRTANVYYYYPIRLGASKFMISPGLGLGMERFKFKNGYFLTESKVNDGQYELVPNVTGTTSIYPGLKKSMLVMDYIDVPVEFRFNSNPDDLARTLWVAVGARAGWLFNGHAKIKYKLDGETILLKDRRHYGLNEFRYGATFRLGVGNFNMFGFYNLSPLFAKDKGPSQTQMTTFTFGISLIGL